MDLFTVFFNVFQAASAQSAAFKLDAAGFTANNTLIRLLRLGAGFLLRFFHHKSHSFHSL